MCLCNLCKPKITQSLVKNLVVDGVDIQPNMNNQKGFFDPIKPGTFWTLYHLGGEGGQICPQAFS